MTISSGKNAKKSSRSKSEVEDETKEPELHAEMIYTNNLLVPPFNPKFVKCPMLSLSRFIDHEDETQLEKEWNWDLLTENDFGVKVDLIHPDAYAINDEAILAEEDQAIIEDETELTDAVRRSLQHAKQLPWMRKTEYISADTQKFGIGEGRSETKVGYNLKKQKEKPTAEEDYDNVDKQIKIIQKTFEDAQTPVKSHPTKKGVHAIDELPLFPDEGLWKYSFAQVQFDADPTPLNCSTDIAQAKMSCALIRGMQDEEGKNFVAYFVPTDDTLSKKLIKEAEERSKNEEDKGDDGLDQGELEKSREEYILLRNYNWNLRMKGSANFDQAYFVVLRPSGASYVELETRVKLFRRRIGGIPQAVTKSRLFINRTPLDDTQIAHQMGRLGALKPLSVIAQEQEALKEVDEDQIAQHSDQSSDSEKDGKKSSDKGDESPDDDAPMNKEANPFADSSDDDDNEEKIAQSGSSSDEGRQSGTKEKSGSDDCD